MKWKRRIEDKEGKETGWEKAGEGREGNRREEKRRGKEGEEKTGEKEERWMERRKGKLECGPMPNLMVALPNIGGALCSTPQSLADAHY